MQVFGKPKVKGMQLSSNREAAQRGRIQRMNIGP